MKKILFVIPSFLRGGMENMLVNIANVLAEKAEVTVYNLCGHDDSMVAKLDKRVAYFSYWQPCKNPLKCGFSNLIRGNFRLLPASVWYKMRSGGHIHDKMILQHFDVEVAFFVGEPIRIVSGCHAQDTKTVMWLHSDYEKSRGLFDCFPSKKDAIAAFRNFSHVVCVSEMAKGAYHRLTGLNNGEVIYNYLPVREIQEKAKAPFGGVKTSGKFSLVAVGRLVKCKGFDRLIRVVRLLNDEHIDCELTIVGDGAERQYLESLSAGDAQKYIHFTGQQENPYPHIASADLLVCSSEYEGYNLTVAEALILGVPVLSTKCTGPTELLDNGTYGMLVDNNEDALYKGIKEMITDRSLWEHYRRQAKQRAAFFSEERLIRQLYTLFLDEE